MDLDSVVVQLEAVNSKVNWKAWLINTEEYEPYDTSSGILEMEATATLTTGTGTKGTFADQVHSISKYASYLSESIFTEVGEFREDKQGFGGLDLDKCDVIWLESIWVGKDYRNQGVAKKMLSEAKKIIQAELDVSCMITYPRPVREEFDESVPLEEKWDTAMRHFRALGFRRILQSPYFIHDPDRQYHGRAVVPPTMSSLNFAQKA